MIDQVNGAEIRAKALEEAAKIMDDRAEMYRKKLEAKDFAAPDDRNGYDACQDYILVCEYGAQAIRSIIP